MMLLNAILALLLILVSFFSISNFPSASAQIPTTCNSSCLGRSVPYPFGFSDGCEIILQCANERIEVGGFRVLNITSNAILLDVPPKCSRRVGEATKFFGRNFALTLHNGLLLQNCTGNLSGCSISSSLLVERRFELQNCTSKIDDDIQCYSQQTKDGFLEFEKLNSTNCSVLFSSVTVGNGSVEGLVEMEFRTVELGWWVNGSCANCSTHANCTEVVSPVNKRRGHRCQCVEGYEGDGFVAGVGCRKVGHGIRFSGNIRLFASLISTLVIGTILSATIIYCLWRKRNRKGRPKKWSFYASDFTDVTNVNDILDVPFIDFECLVEATDNFSDSNKLGKGGFGIVYKGTHSGQEIAVKRLSKGSGQGLEEFKNEAVLIAKLQHRNLVRILGYCIEGSEKMLIYEYMPNKSLNFFLFDATLRSILDWEKRNNIIMGIARGLLYLHQDSRLRIIHRDLKTSNILLDKDMNPKISDFGMARTFGADQMQENTNRVVGTYGYISPEYAANGQYSVKSDVYSFGIIMLEIISGKRNADFSQDENAPSLTAYAWQLWKERRRLELMDRLLQETCNETQVLNCIHLGLLCVQDNASDRQTMSRVLAMLDGEIASLPTPNQPAFFRGCFSAQPRTGSSDRMPRYSKNEVTISTLVAR